MNNESRGIDHLLSLGDGRDVFRLRGSTGANVYLIRDGQEGLLVDSGFAEDTPRLVRKVRAVLGTQGRLAGILLTHYHKDHAGGAMTLSAATGAEICCSEADAAVFRGEREYVRLPRDLSSGTEQFLAATPMWEKCFQGGDEWFPRVDRIIHPGELLSGFRVIAMPGHTPGHLCLFDEVERVLLSADYLVYPSEELPQFFKKFVRSVHLDPREALVATRELMRLPFDALLPGHGQPVLQNARTVLSHSALYCDLREVAG